MVVPTLRWQTHIYYAEGNFKLNVESSGSLMHMEGSDEDEESVVRNYSGVGKSPGHLPKSSKRNPLSVLRQAIPGVTPDISSKSKMCQRCNFHKIQQIVTMTMCNSRNLRELDLGERKVENLIGDWLSHFPESDTSLVSLNISCMASKVDLSALEHLVSHSPNLRILRLNRAVTLEKLADILRHASQLVEFGNGAYFSGRQVDPIEVDINVRNPFSDCYQIEGLSGFWEAVPDYFPLIYPVHHRLTFF